MEHTHKSTWAYPLQKQQESSLTLHTSTNFSHSYSFTVTQTPPTPSPFPDHHNLNLLPFISGVLALYPLHITSCRQRTSIILFLSSSQTSPPLIINRQCSFFISTKSISVSFSPIQNVTFLFSTLLKHAFDTHNSSSRQNSNNIPPSKFFWPISNDPRTRSNPSKCRPSCPLKSPTHITKSPAECISHSHFSSSQEDCFSSIHLPDRQHENTTLLPHWTPRQQNTLLPLTPRRKSACRAKPHQIMPKGKWNVGGNNMQVTLSSQVIRNLPCQPGKSC